MFNRGANVDQLAQELKRWTLKYDQLEGSKNKIDSELEAVQKQVLDIKKVRNWVLVRRLKPLGLGAAPSSSYNVRHRRIISQKAPKYRIWKYRMSVWLGSFALGNRRSLVCKIKWQT